jgi:hypothetical protein
MCDSYLGYVTRITIIDTFILYIHTNDAYIFDTSPLRCDQEYEFNICVVPDEEGEREEKGEEE